MQTLNYLNYKDTLEIVEKFMINSGIREYCTKICKGKCCSGCYELNPKACWRCEGRRLSCSIYLCNDLLIFFGTIDKKILKTILNARANITKEYRKYSIHNIYFNLPNNKFFKQSRFSKTAINKLLDLQTINKVNKMIKKYDRHRNYKDGLKQ